MQFLGIIFIIGLVLEIISIIFVSKLIGGLATLIIIILSFLFGSWLIRRNAGIAQIMMAGTLYRAQGNMSMYELMWPIRIPIAGFLFMVPGFISSIIAILLLIPFKGKQLNQQSNIFTSFGGNFQQQYGSSKDDDDIIEGEFVVRRSKSNSNNKTIQHKE